MRSLKMEDRGWKIVAGVLLFSIFMFSLLLSPSLARAQNSGGDELILKNEEKPQQKPEQEQSGSEMSISTENENPGPAEGLSLSLYESWNSYLKAADSGDKVQSEQALKQILDLRNR